MIISVFFCSAFQKILDNFLDNGDFLEKIRVLRLFEIIKIYLLKS